MGVHTVAESTSPNSSASITQADQDSDQDPRGFLNLLKRSGPAFLSGGLNIGSATITNSIILAAATGFMFGWVFIPTTFAIYMATIACVKITIVTKQDPIQVMRTKIHPVYAWVNAIPMLIVNLVFFSTNTLLAGAALHALIPQIPVRVLAIVALFITAAISLFPRRIHIADALIKYLVYALVVVYVIALCVVPIHWSTAFGKLATFSIPQSKSDVLMFTAVLGAALSITNPTIQAFGTRNENYGPRQLRLFRFETAAVHILLLVVQFAVFFVVASTLFPKGIEATDAVEASLALRPIAGSGATVLFAIGLFGASISTLVVETQVAGFVVSDLAKWGRDIGAMKFKIVQGILIVVALAIPLFDLDPFKWTISGSAFNSTFMPIGIATWLWLINNKKVMGKYRANRWVNGGIVIALAISVAVVVRFWYVTLS